MHENRMLYKILVVSDYSSFITSRPEAELWKHLAKKGHEIEIITRKPSKHTEAFEKAGIKVHYRHPEQKISLNSIRFIRQKIVDGGFQILHLFNSKAISNGNIAATGTSVKVITYRGAAGLHWHDPSAYLTHLNPRVDQISCLSHFVQQQVDRQFIFRKKKTQVHYKGIDASWFNDLLPAKRAKIDVPEEGFLISCVANYRKVKGIEVLLEAFENLKAENAYLLLIGKGMDSPELKSKISNGAKKDKIRLLGFQENALQWVKASDLYVQPSLKEGLSKSVMEAMVLEIPCIISNAGGMPELIQHSESGWIVEKNNSSELSCAMEELLNDASLRKKLAIKGKERILEKFSMEQYVNGIEQMYRNIQ